MLNVIDNSTYKTCRRRFGDKPVEDTAEDVERGKDALV